MGDAELDEVRFFSRSIFLKANVKIDPSSTITAASTAAAERWRGQQRRQRRAGRAKKVLKQRDWRFKLDVD